MHKKYRFPTFALMVTLFWHPIFELPLPQGHQFPMEKYRRVKEAILQRGIVSPNQIVSPRLLDDTILSLTHSLQYIEKLNQGTISYNEMRRIGFPYSKQMVLREKYICGAMIDASYSAIKHGISFNLAGGTHHAFIEHGSAYCIFNDMAIAANYLLHIGVVKKIMIIDLDAHQGNGTISLLKKRSEVFIFNMYSRDAFPLRKENSNLDIELKPETGDDEYIELLNRGLEKAFMEFTPDLILYQAGVDLLACDKLGKLNLTVEGIRKRDQVVFSTGTKKNIPIAVCMGGGYSTSLEKIIECHCNTIEEATKIKSPTIKQPRDYST